MTYGVIEKITHQMADVFFRNTINV